MSDGGSYRVRLATAADIPAMLEFQTPPGSEPQATADRLAHDFAVRVPADQTFLVLAEVAEGVVAVARASWIERPFSGPDRIPTGWYLQGVRVAEGWRRLGIGRALTKRRLEWLDKRTDTVLYTTTAANRPSIALHRSFGFEQVATGVDAPAAPPRADRLLFRRQRRGFERPPPPPEILS